jgi:toxin CptA
MQLPHTLNLQPSRRLALLLVAAHGGTLASATMIDLPIGFKLLVMVGIVLSLLFALFKMHGSRQVIQLTLRSDGLLEVRRQNEQSGQSESARLRVHPHSMVTSFLTVLLLEQGKRLEALTLLPDALNSEDFRCLRLWLRWKALTAESPSRILPH